MLGNAGCPRAMSVFMEEIFSQEVEETEAG
jgi:hypothetical protein